MTDKTRPPGGHAFEAVCIQPEGWLVLAPWVQTPDGYWWRPHLELQMRSDGESKRFAEHYARAINVAMTELKP